MPVYSITYAEMSLDLKWNQALADPNSQEYLSLQLLLKNLVFYIVIIFLYMYRMPKKSVQVPFTSCYI